MSLNSQLKKSTLGILRFSGIIPIYKSNKTYVQVYEQVVQIFTSEFEKYQFYYYGIKNKLSCVPKISQLIADDKHGIYFIERELLYPIIDTKKLEAIDKIKYCAKNRLPGEDKIAEQLLKFYYLHQGSIDFDFGPHWIMETHKGKLVICDAFRPIEERSKNLSNQF